MFIMFCPTKAPKRKTTKTGKCRSAAQSAFEVWGPLYNMACYDIQMFTWYSTTFSGV